MNVDINQYRAAIGSFIQKGNLPRKIYSKPSKTNERNNYFKFIKVLLLIINILVLFQFNDYFTSFNTSKTIPISEKHILTTTLIGTILNRKMFFIFSELDNGTKYYKFTNLENKYAKYTYGNRKHGGIKIYHFNKGPAHLCNRIHEIENIISKHRPSILGISESNYFHNHDWDSVQIENYSFITAKTLQNPDLKVSRVCVYLHNSMVGKIREDLMDDTFSSIWLEVGLPQKRKILICNLYREWAYMRQENPALSREISAQENRWSGFLNQWERALAEDKEVICLGDVNINHNEWTREDLPPNNSTKKQKKMIDALFTRILPHGVSQLVTGSTRVRNDQESGIDHFYSNQPDKLSPIQTMTCGGSDHKLFGATRYATSIKRNVRYVTKRCFKNFKKEEFLSAVRQINWWQIYECNDVEIALEILTQRITQILDLMAPIRTIQVKENYAPWLSKETKAIMAERDRAQEAAAESKNDEDWSTYKRLRNRVNSLLRNEKRNWQRNKFIECEDEKDSKQIWKNIKSWLNWTSSGAPTQLFYEGQLENRPCRLAYCMNKFFIDKITNLRDNLGESQLNPLDNLRRLMAGRKSVFSLKPVHPDTVDKLISNLKNSGSVGLDYIGTGIIKQAKKELLPALTHIINLSIKQSKFPTQFKKAKVIPLFKSGDKLSPSNYRPVAILPIWSKLVERAVFIQMIEYFESNNLIHPSHHGFRANHNTTTALLQMYDNWVEAMDRGEATGVIYLDMSAAFDMVEHSVLLEKLLLYGFDIASYTWIKSYLEDRQQTVCIDGTCSPLLKVNIGVPQGSIIGPLLYIIFTNDLPEIVHNHIHPQEPQQDPTQEPQDPPQEQQHEPQQEPQQASQQEPQQDHPQEPQQDPPQEPQQDHPQERQDHSYNMYCHTCGSLCCFADDSSYSYSNKDPVVITEILTEKYNTIAEYMKSHKLKLNGGKTHLMLLLSDTARRTRNDTTVELDTGDALITTTQWEKLLGGFIGQNLKFTEHIQNNEKSMIKTLNKRLNALRKVSKYASFKSRKMIANGIIMSNLTYLICWWSGCEDYLMNSLQVIQNKAARMVTKCGKRTPIKSLLSQCGWLSVKQLSVYHSLILVYKVLATQSPQYLYMKLSGVQGATFYETRYMKNKQANQGIVLGDDSQATSELARNSFKYRATEKWNILPLEIRSAGKLTEFKRLLKAWVLENVDIK